MFMINRLINRVVLWALFIMMNRIINRVVFRVLFMMNEYSDGKVNWSVNRVVIQTLFMMNDYSDGKIHWHVSHSSLDMSNIKHFIIQLTKLCPWQLYWSTPCWNLNMKLWNKAVNTGVFLNVFTEVSELSDQNICHHSKRARNCDLSCKRPGC